MSGPFLKPAESKSWFEATAAEFASADPILPLNTGGIESDTGIMKLGDGSSVWSALKALVPECYDLIRKDVPNRFGELVFVREDLTNGAYVDAYTCPTGYKAVVGHLATYAPAATFYPPIAIKKSGVEIQILRGLNNSAGRSYQFAELPFVLEAGESLSVRGEAVNQKVRAEIYLVPDTTPMRTEMLEGVNSSERLLYTVPDGKVAILPGFSPSSTWGTGVLVNTTGATRTLTVYLVPNGEVLAATHQIDTRTVINTTIQYGQFPVGPMLGPGEKVYVKTDANDAGQTAWMTVVEIDA